MNGMRGMGEQDTRRRFKRHVNVSNAGWVFFLIFAFTTISAAAQSFSDPARLHLESAWRQDFPISVRTGRESAGNVYRAGEKLQISVLASITGYLQVFATSPDGEVVQLFPDEATANTRIPPAREVRVPPDTSRFALQISKAAGTDLLTVVVTDRPHPLLHASDLRRTGNALLVRYPNRLASLLRDLGANSSPKACIQHIPIHTAASDFSGGGFGVASATDGWRAHLWVHRDPVPADDPIVVRVVSNQSCRLKGFFISDTPHSKKTDFPLKNPLVLDIGRIIHAPGASDSFSLKLRPPNHQASVHVTLQRSDGATLQVSCPVTSTSPTAPAPRPPSTSNPSQTTSTTVSASASSTVFPHPPKPVSVTLGTSSGNAPTVVSWGNAVNVVFPPESVSPAQVVTIGPPSHAPPIASGCRILSSCQVTLTGAPLKSPAVVALRFDRGALPQDAVPEAIMAVRWDAQTETWEPRPTSVDMKQGVAVTTTEQFSLWYLIYIAQMCVVENTENFRLVYVRPGWVQTVSGPNSEGETFAILGPQMRYMQGPEAAFLVRQFIERAYQAYGQAGLPRLFSGARTRAEAAAAAYLGLNLRPFTEWVFLNCNPTGWRLDRQIGVDPNYRSGITGAIVLNRDFDDLDDLRVTVAHELFHAIQNEYSNLITQGPHEWWADATADFAACRVAWGGQIDLDPIANPIAWLEPPLWDTANNRAYYGDHLVGHLLDTIPGATLPNLMTTTFGRVLGGVHGRLEEFTRNLTQEAFHVHFQRFAARLLFTGRIPVGTPFLGSGQAQQRTVALPATARILATQTVDVPLGMSATARLIRADVPAGRRSRRLRVHVNKTDWLNVWLYHLPGGQPLADPQPLADFSRYDPDHVLDVAPGDLIALLACNFGWNQIRNPDGLQRFTFSVTDESPILTLAATPENGDQSRLVLRAQAVQVPPEARRLRWDWQVSDKRNLQDHSNNQGQASLVMERRVTFPRIAEQALEVRLFDVTAAAATELGLATMTWRPIDLALAADPNPVEAESPCELQADAKNAPRGVKYKFYFGDTSLPREIGTDQISHGWTAPGRYSAGVHLLASGTSGELLAMASLTIQVVPANLGDLRLTAPFPSGYVERQRGEYADGNQDFAEGLAFKYQILERSEMVSGEFVYFDLRGPTQKLGAGQGRATFTARMRFIEAKTDDPWLKQWGSPLPDRESHTPGVLPYNFDRPRNIYTTSAEGRKKGHPPQVIGRFGNTLIIILIEFRCMGEKSPSGQASFIPGVSIDAIAQSDAETLWNDVAARVSRKKPASPR